jgi:hypothetical protein
MSSIEKLKYILKSGGKTILIAGVFFATCTTLSFSEDNMSMPPAQMSPSEHQGHHAKGDSKTAMPAMEGEKEMSSMGGMGSQNKMNTPSKSKEGGPLAPLQRALEQGHASGAKDKKVKKHASHSKNSMAPSGAPMNQGSGGMMGKGMTEMMGKMMGQMGQANGMPANPVASELPGFSGASHLYHVGTTGFFLDHLDMAGFTPEQQTKLNQIKESALLNQAMFERKTDQAEQELWILTSAEKPDISLIELKVKEIEIQKGEERLGFIRLVGEAAKVLTPEQRSIILGQMPSQNIVGRVPGSNPAAPPSSMNPPGASTNGGMKAMPTGNDKGSMEPGDM